MITVTPDSKQDTLTITITGLRWSALAQQINNAPDPLSNEDMQTIERIAVKMLKQGRTPEQAKTVLQDDRTVTL